MRAETEKGRHGEAVTQRRGERDLMCLDTFILHPSAFIL